MAPARRNGRERQGQEQEDVQGNRTGGEARTGGHSVARSDSHRASHPHSGDGSAHGVRGWSRTAVDRKHAPADARMSAYAIVIPAERRARGGEAMMRIDVKSDQVTVGGR